MESAYPIVMFELDWVMEARDTNNKDSATALVAETTYSAS